MTRRKVAEAAKNSPFASTPPQAPGPMEGIQGEIPATEKGKPLRSALKEKGKVPGYKLAADIETSTNLKGMLDHMEVMDLATKEDDAIKSMVRGEDDDGYHHLAFVSPSLFDLDVNEGEDGREIDSDYRREHWARATAEVQIKLGGLEEAVTALVDNGSEINIMSKELYDRGQ
ncbi:hypothetical protein R1sor_018825 [Riccia sorocarpa]|uniref:Uncharacterized protein n=1 Tax=Riccia sorocarpa TaxID=122646 RepID=A0ABD3IAW8_9MARC